MVLQNLINVSRYRNQNRVGCYQFRKSSKFCGKLGKNLKRLYSDFKRIIVSFFSIIIMDYNQLSGPKG